MPKAHGLLPASARRPVWRPAGAVLTPTYPAGHGSGGARRLEAFRESRTGLRLSGAVDRIRRALGRGEIRIRAPFDGNGYRHEAIAVMDAVRQGQSEAKLMPLSESIEVMEIIDQARADWFAGGAG